MPMKSTIWAAALAVLVAFHGAAAETLPPPHHWAYWGPDQPKKWVNWFPTCGLKAQSPVDIPYAGSLEDLAPLAPSISGSCVHALFESKGPDYKWEFEAPNDCKAVGAKPSVSYDLLQVHLHSPSEHTINGVSFDAELHFVHKSADGNLLVLGVLLDSEGSNDNAWVANLFTPLPFVHAPSLCQPKVVIGEPKDIIPTTGKWFNYQGSLTTPPCSEVVDWWVAAEPVRVSSAQIELLKEKALIFPDTKRGQNNRPVQALNGRAVRPLA